MSGEPFIEKQADLASVVSAPIFRTAPSRFHAACRNIPILCPFALAAAALQYFLLGDLRQLDGQCMRDSKDQPSDSLAMGMVFCEVISLVLGPLGSNNILTSGVFLTLCSAVAALLRYHLLQGGASVVGSLLFFLGLWATVLASLAVSFMLVVELVTACPVLWPFFRRFQDLWQGVVHLVRERVLFFLPTDIEVFEQIDHSWKRTRSPEGTVVNSPSVTQTGRDDVLLTGASTDIADTEGTPAGAYGGNVLLERVAEDYRRKSSVQKALSGLQWIHAVLREFVLVPIIIIPFIVDPYLSRFVDKNPTADTTYLFVLHGSGANTGEWILGRFMLTIRGYGDHTLWANYLPGWMHVANDGGVDHLADKILPEIAREVEGIVASRTSKEKVNVVIMGHSLGADLTAELMHRLYDKHAKLNAGAAAAARLFLSSARIQEVICLSGPFRGSRVLGVLQRILPKSIYHFFELDEPPNIDFYEGSVKSEQLIRYVQNELIGATQHFAWSGPVTLFCGGTDWIVTPVSGLCCVGPGDQASIEPARSQDGCGLDGLGDAGVSRQVEKRFCYVSNVGHYSIVACGPLWHKVLGVLRGPEPDAGNMHARCVGLQGGVDR
eukprot:TRINITY_DN23033_c0_g1_i2.p1 TRINITY_DN23033_c0_g1~~TRINITY_DN23033_c0_g1_i2.p1  ORF type:complete len:608 (+),score=55.20 TRINITY_DN23033_c0_g1_i2:95-1918(+)